MRLKNFCHLLPLAYKPQDAVSILDWCPFPRGKSLAEMIEAHNRQCLESYQQNFWLDELIEELGEGIEVLSHDLSSVGKLRTSDFPTIRILLVKTDDVLKEVELLEPLKLRMMSAKHVYHLAQVGDAESDGKVLKIFKGLAIHPSQPKVFTRQEEFRLWLSRFCSNYQTALGGIPLPPSDTPDLRALAQKIPAIASQVRDFSIVNNLSESQTMNLARIVAQQEVLLHQAVRDMPEPLPLRNVLLDKIRISTEDLFGKCSEERIERGSVKLVSVSLKRPIHELTAEQKDMTKELGLKGKTYSTIFFDRNQTWKKLKALESILDTSKFKADLFRG